MSKKFVAGLLPLLAFAAFVAAPAAAQAQGRWFLGTTELSGTENVLNGGKAVVLTDATAGVTLTCEVASTGTITNSSSKTANGTDSITAFTVTNCTVSGAGGEKCTATVKATNLPWATVLNATGTEDTITGATVEVTLKGTCAALEGKSERTITYGSKTSTLADKITNNVTPPTGTPNCKVATLQSALSGSLTSSLGTTGVISGNVYICTSADKNVSAK